MNFSPYNKLMACSNNTDLAEVFNGAWAKDIELV